MMSALLHSEVVATGAVCVALVLFATTVFYVAHRIGRARVKQARVRAARAEIEGLDVVSRALFPQTPRPIVPFNTAEVEHLARTVH